MIPFILGALARKGASIILDKDVKKAYKKGVEIKTALYRTAKGGYSIKRKRGKTSVKDPLIKAINEYLTSGGPRISKVYAYASRVMHGAPGMQGVRFEDGAKGWIKDDGGIILEKDVRDVLHSLDCLNVVAREGISLEGLYDAMSPAKKAEFARLVDGFDWNTFWKEMYPDGHGASDDRQTDLFYDLLAHLKLINKW